MIQKSVKLFLAISLICSSGVFASKAFAQSGTHPGGIVAPTSADITRVEETARNQARMTANDVVRKYAPGENARYNLWVGLHQGVQQYQQMSDYNQDADYKSSYRQGSYQGELTGISIGRTEALNQAQNLASQDVNGRYRTVVDVPQRPDVTVRIPKMDYPGATADKKDPESIDARITDQAAILNNYMSGYPVQNSTAAFGQWSDYQFTTVSSWYGSNWAFDAWVDQRLGGGDSSQQNYFRKISDSNLTSNSTEAKEAFVRAFKNEYSNVVDDKFVNAVKIYNADRQIQGRNIGNEIGRAYAQEKGQVDGYRLAFTTSSVRGFYQNFPLNYSDSFNSEIQRHENSPVVDSIAVHLIDKANSNLYFLPLQSFDLVVDKLVNTGARGVVLAQVSGNLTPLQPQQVSLEAEASFKIPATLKDIGALGQFPSPYAVTPVSVTIGGISSTVNVQVYFSSVAKMLAITGQARFFDYVRYYCNFEFTKWSVSANLKTLISIYNSSNPKEKLNISNHREELRASYGKRPSGWFDGDEKRAWDAIQVQLNLLN